MQVVVADTGPLNYLILIGLIDLLPKLFGTIIVPDAVRDELSSLGTPAAIRVWVADVPSWLEIRPNPIREYRDAPSILDQGERAAIALAIAAHADLIIMDDRDGVAFARSQGFAVTGTLGVLDLAARRGLIDLVEAFTRLKATSFHYRQGLLDSLLAKRKEDK